MGFRRRILELGIREVYKHFKFSIKRACAGVDDGFDILELGSGV